MVPGNIYLGSDAEKGFEVATIKLDPGDSIVEVSGEYNDYIVRIRFRSKNNKVMEVGGQQGRRAFKSLIPKRQKLLFFGGTVTNELRTIYCYTL